MSNIVRRLSHPFLSFPSFPSFKNNTFETLEREMDRVFEETFNNDFFNVIKKSSYPKLDVIKKDGKYIIQLAVPGVKKENLSVEISSDNSSVIISGKMEDSYKYEKDEIVHKELHASQFSRVVPLDPNIDGEVDAKLEDGVLILSWKLKEIREPPKLENKKVDIK